jgi:cobalt-zinc-cadmium resistance protein CzcA
MSLKASGAAVAYNEALRKSGTDIEKTAVMFEYGKFNSMANDNRYAVSQTIQFPTVYKFQNAINRINIGVSESSRYLREIELKSRIRSMFFQLLIMRGKMQLLGEADSIYTEFITRSTVRFKMGDIDALELAALENQQFQISSQRQMLEAGYKVAKRELQLLMNTEQAYDPTADSMVYREADMAGAFDLHLSPLLKIDSHKVALAGLQHKLEKSKLLPSATIGVNNATIIGWQSLGQNHEQYYGQGERFTSVNVSLGVPLFYGAQRSKIKAAAIQRRMYEFELSAARKQLVADLDRAIETRNRYQDLVLKFQQRMLPNAATIIRTANQKLAVGEIGYVDWTVLVNQAVQIKSDYLDMVQRMNEATFDIEKIVSNN